MASLPPPLPCSTFPLPSLSPSIWYFWYSCCCLHFSYATAILDATLKCLHKFAFCFAVWQFFNVFVVRVSFARLLEIFDESLSLYVCVCVYGIRVCTIKILTLPLLSALRCTTMKQKKNLKKKKINIKL